MSEHNFQVQVGDQVFLEEGGDEIGAVRQVLKDHVVIYVEGAGDFVLKGPEVRSAHDGKLVLDAQKLPEPLRIAAQAAHDNET